MDGTDPLKKDRSVLDAWGSDLYKTWAVYGALIILLVVVIFTILQRRKMQPDMSTTEKKCSLCQAVNAMDDETCGACGAEFVEKEKKEQD